MFLGETTTPQPTTIPPIQNKTCGNPDENILGVPIKIIHGIDTWQHCAYLCNQDNKCQAWTWYSEKYPLDSFSGDCDLKEKDEGKAKAKGIISGTSDCGRDILHTTSVAIFCILYIYIDFVIIYFIRFSTNITITICILNNHTKPRNRNDPTRRERGLQQCYHDHQSSGQVNKRPCTQS